MLRKTLFIICCGLLVGLKCDQTPPPATAVVSATVTDKPLEVGASFRATLRAESVVPRFLSKERAKSLGQIRAIETTTAVETAFFAELVELSPAEKWRIDFETYTRTTQTQGGEQATSSHELPDNAFFVEFQADSVVVTDEHGAAATDSQVRVCAAIGEVLRERHAWAKFVSSRQFGQGKVIAAPDGFVLGRFIESMFGSVSHGNTTVSFFRFGEDAAKRELAYFDVHSRFRATDEQVTDGSYFDLEATGRAVLRVADGLLSGYDVSAKVTPRAATGAMLPEGSGKWSMAFEIDATTFGSR